MDKKCRFCDKIISGQTVLQVERLLLIHIVSKHPDKVKIEEVK